MEDSGKVPRLKISAMRYYENVLELFITVNAVHPNLGEAVCCLCDKEIRDRFVSKVNGRCVLLLCSVITISVGFSLSGVIIRHVCDVRRVKTSWEKHAF